MKYRTNKIRQKHKRRQSTKKNMKGGLINNLFSKNITNIEEIKDCDFSKKSTPRLWNIAEGMKKYPKYQDAYEYYFADLDKTKCDRLNQIRQEWIVYKQSDGYKSDLEKIDGPQLITHKIQSSILPSVSNTRYVSFLLRQFCIDTDKTDDYCMQILGYGEISNIEHVKSLPDYGDERKAIYTMDEDDRKYLQNQNCLQAIENLEELMKQMETDKSTLTMTKWSESCKNMKDRCNISSCNDMVGIQQKKNDLEQKIFNTELLFNSNESPETPETVGGKKSKKSKKSKKDKNSKKDKKSKKSRR